MAYPLENNFRKPVELISSAVALAAAGVLWLEPHLFLVTPVTGAATTAGLVALANWRASQAWRLIRFQRNLLRLSDFTIEADELPWSDEEVYLGRGFVWTAAHTQRLYQARLPENRHLVTRSRWYERARDLERAWPDGWLAHVTAKPARWNPVAPVPRVGGDPVLHGIEPCERDIWFDVGERVGHMAVLGATRVGKTRLCELLVGQDIRRGDVVIVFDPKGDVDLLLSMYAEAVRCGREREFTFFHLGYPDKSSRYSPIGTFSRITEVATRIAGNLPDEGQSAAFRDFVWRFVNVMARAMTALGIRPTYELVYQHAVNIDGLALKYLEFWLDRDHPTWRDALPQESKDMAERAKKTGRTLYAMQVLALMQANHWHEPVADALASVLNNDRTYFEKLVSSLYPLLEKLTSGKMGQLLSPDYDDPNDLRPVFDWNRVIDTGGIVYVGLDALSDFEVASVVGSAMFADLTSTAGRIYKHGHAYGQGARPRTRKVSIHADEFNELVGDEFIPLVNKAGGAGFQVTAYTQTSADLEAKVGSRAKAEQIFGNFNTLVMLRVKYLATAKILTDQLPPVQVRSLTPSSSAADAVKRGEGTAFTAQTHDRMTVTEAPMLQPAELMRLPKGQAFALIEGGQLVKIRLPLLTRNDGIDGIKPMGLEEVVASMRAKYAQYVRAADAASAEAALLESLASSHVGQRTPRWGDVPIDAQVMSSSLITEGRGSDF